MASPTGKPAETGLYGILQFMVTVTMKRMITLRISELLQCPRLYHNEILGIKQLLGPIL